MEPKNTGRDIQGDDPAGFVFESSENGLSSSL